MIETRPIAERPARRHRGPEQPPVAPRLLLGLGAVAAVVVGVAATTGGSAGNTAVQSAAAMAPAAAPEPAPSVEAEPTPLGLSADEIAAEVDGCLIDETSLQLGDSGDGVTCVQRALGAAGYYDGPVDGVFSDALDAATSSFQADQELYVDGIVGRNTAAALGIWPGAEAFIVRTPPPASGAMDSMGYLLSSVASTGSDAPPLPEGADQVSGKRIVYERAGQRVWAIDDDGRIVRSYLVSGSQFNNEQPGVHRVYSKSETALGWNLTADLPYMVRYLQTDRGHIGFHEIPIHKDDGTRYQTEDELGQKLSGGCQRQAPLDALFMWNFADVGTPVIVV